MTAALAAVVSAAAGEPVAPNTSFDGLAFDVPAPAWRAVALALRDDPRAGCEFFDWLSAYDDRDGGVVIAARVYSLAHRHGVIVRCRLDPIALVLDSLVDVWAGAEWHERETFEMFGVRFEGHPNLVPLLLPDGFEGHPLRKEFVLAARVAKDWPGQKQPGESDRDLAAEEAARRSRRMRPPGVPAPGSWGQQ